MVMTFRELSLTLGVSLNTLYIYSEREELKKLVKTIKNKEGKNCRGIAKSDLKEFVDGLKKYYSVRFNSNARFEQKIAEELCVVSMLESIRDEVNSLLADLGKEEALPIDRGMDREKIKDKLAGFLVAVDIRRVESIKRMLMESYGITAISLNKTKFTKLHELLNS